MLGEYLKSAASRPFKWGEHDCCTFCAEWMGSLVGADLLQGWRGNYDSEGDALPMIEAEGGLVEIFEQQIAGRAWRGGSPVAGSVAVVEFAGKEVGAIFTGERWAMLTPRRLAVVLPARVKVIESWKAS